MIIFQYKEEHLANGKKIKRPVADISLKTISNQWIEFHPYIDSGADITIIPYSLGKLLGFEVAGNKVSQIGGIRGGVPVIYIESLIKIGLNEFKINIAWSLIDEVPPLLGRTDVFEKFNITFKQIEGLIIFEER